VTGIIRLFGVDQASVGIHGTTFAGHCYGQVGTSKYVKTLQDFSAKRNPVKQNKSLQDPNKYAI